MPKRKQVDDHLDDILAPELGDALNDIHNLIEEKEKRPKKKAKLNSKKEGNDIPIIRRNELPSNGWDLTASKENIIEKRTKIEKIRGWERTFPKELEYFFKDKDHEKLSIEELDEMMDEIKFIVET